MLEELKNLNYNGGKNGLLFFLCDVIGNHSIELHDAKILCSHAPGRHYLSVEELACYCNAFGWIKEEDNRISVSTDIISVLFDKEELNRKLITDTISRLFSEEVLNPSMFSYDSVLCCYSFKNEQLPLELSSVRNVLISQGFLITSRDSQGVRFYISSEYEELIANHCKKQHRKMSIDSLNKILEKNEIAGEKAELFVIEYEKVRIGSPLCDKIKRISEIDASAGYDIVSFNSSLSRVADRFIEVKAVSSDGFFWSRNEYEIAKLKGTAYYLYLVDLKKVFYPGYYPEIIQDPASIIMDSDDWFVESQSYHIKHV